MPDTMAPADAQTRFAEVDGTRFAWREYGENQPDQVPLVLLHRFRAALDDWDPLLLDLLARERRVIAFDNRGVGESGGETPATLEQAADDAAAFMRAIGVGQADVLGWSMGGMTAPILGLRHPSLVRRMVLCGTLPAGGSPEVVPSPPAWGQVAGKPAYEDEDILFLFFTGSEASRAAGRASLARMARPGRPGSAVKTTPATMQAQLAAIIRFYKNEGGWFERLREVRQPALVANGDRDGAFPVIDSVVLARELPRSQLAIYAGPRARAQIPPPAPPPPPAQRGPRPFSHPTINASAFSSACKQLADVSRVAGPRWFGGRRSCYLVDGNRYRTCRRKGLSSDTKG